MENQDVTCGNRGQGSTQLVSVGAVANVNTGGIAYVAHIAGMIFGAVAARFFADPERRVEASQGAAC